MESSDESDIEESRVNPLGQSFFQEESDAASLQSPKSLSQNDSDQQICHRTLAILTSADFVLEPNVGPTLNEYLKAGGAEEKVVDCLSSGYEALGQICNLMGEWLLQLDDDAEAVQKAFELPLHSLIFKYFDPTLADRIFHQSCEGQGIDWLEEMIGHSRWRSLVYSLAEHFADCLMLRFAVQMISKAGLQHEIVNVSTAAQQLDIFSSVLCHAIDCVLAQHNTGPATESYESVVKELIRVACHSEHTYLYTTALLSLVSHQEDGQCSAAAHHLRQTLRIAAKRDKKQDATAYSLALLASIWNDDSERKVNRRLSQAMYSMLNRGALNPADITLLYNIYSQKEAPPIDLLRDDVFLNLLIDSLFRPKGPRIHKDHRAKYIYLLAYSSSVCETRLNGRRVRESGEELDRTRDALDRLSRLCQQKSVADACLDLVLHLPQVFRDIKLSPVASGLLHWIKCTITETDYFKLHPEPLSVHLALLDEIATNHPLLHLKVFDLLTDLFDRDTSTSDNSLGEVLMERQRTFIDRLVHLLSVGFALPVTQFVVHKFREGQADISLIRYFAKETLEIISPPYSSNFLQVFLPLLENHEIFDESVHEKVPAAKEFIDHCSVNNFNIQ